MKRVLNQKLSIVLVMIIIIGFLIAYIPCAKAATINVPTGYPTIQSAIDAASDGDVIIVDEGTYYENINFLGKAIVLKSTNPKNVDVVTNTIIDANQISSAVIFDNGEDPNSVLRGFTIQNGIGYLYLGAVRLGGGIYCAGSSPTIANCIITSNSALNGGGIWLSSDQGDSRATIYKCIITGNSVAGVDYGEGGGILHKDGNLSIANCIISDNNARLGGGINIYKSISISTEINNCVITDNSADENGGGIYCVSDSTTITNCLVTSNSADEGGGIFCWWSSPEIVNCTIADNSVAANGGGIYYDNSPSSSVITNCILWNNSDEIFVYTDPNNTLQYPKVTYSDIQGGYYDPNTTNIDEDPLFIDPNLEDYHLDPNSPCIDMGTEVDPNYDLDGRPRPKDGDPNDGIEYLYDMGAYEYGEITLKIILNDTCFTTGDKITINGTAYNPAQDPINLDYKTVIKPLNGAPILICEVNSFTLNSGINDIYADPNTCSYLFNGQEAEGEYSVLSKFIRPGSNDIIAEAQEEFTFDPIDSNCGS